MVSVFTYIGQNVDDLDHATAIKALKQCIHELEQERRNKQSDAAGGWPCPQISVDDLLQRAKTSSAPKE